MGANTASHEEQHYLSASVSEGKFVVLFKHDLIAKKNFFALAILNRLQSTLCPTTNCHFYTFQPVM